VIAYQRALNLAPERADLHIALGHALIRLRRWDEADTSLRRAAVMAPKEALAHVGLGHIARQRGEWEQAIASYRARYSSSLNSPRLTTGWARHSAVLGSAKMRVLPSPRPSVSILPIQTPTPPWRKFCTLPASMNRHCPCSNRRWRLTVKMPGPIRRAAKPYAALGQWQEAGQAYREAIRRRPRWAAPHAGIAAVFAALDRPAAARRRWKRQTTGARIPDSL
jgi:tetratricopeptide (TPR) repeat protein